MILFYFIYFNEYTDVLTYEIPYLKLKENGYHSMNTVNSQLAVSIVSLRQECPVFGYTGCWSVYVLPMCVGFTFSPKTRRSGYLETLIAHRYD